MSEPRGDLPMDSDVPEQEPPIARRRGARVFRERWDILLVIAAGGALGSLARWALNQMIPSAPEQVPWATAVENVTGGLLLGALMVLILDYWPPSRYLRPFVGVGILGSYTTFSTYMLDTRNLLAAGRFPAAAGYMFGSLIVGLMAVGLGVLIARAGVAAAERQDHHRRERRQREQEQRARPSPVRVSDHSPHGADHDADQNPDHDPDQDPDTTTDRDTAGRTPQ